MTATTNRPGTIQQDPVLTGTKKTAVVLILIFLAISALIGIIALFTGEWSDTHARIIATTLLFAAISVILLVLINVFERIGVFTFWLNLIVSGITLITSLLMVWYQPLYPENMVYYNVRDKVLLQGIILTMYLMHTTLIFLMHRRSHVAIKTTVAITFILSTLLAVYFSLATYNVPVYEIPEIGRFIAAFLILIVLGTIGLPILGKVLKEPALGSRITSIELPAGIIQILRKRAAEKNMSIPELLGELLGETQGPVRPDEIVETLENDRNE